MLSTLHFTCRKNYKYNVCLQASYVMSIDSEMMFLTERFHAARHKPSVCLTIHTASLFKILKIKAKGKSEHLYRTLHGTNYSKALRHGSHSF